MNILWVHNKNCKDLSNYSQSLIDYLRLTNDFEILQHSDHLDSNKKNNNKIILFPTSPKGKWSNWLANKWQYATILKKWNIDKIILDNISIQFETSLPQILLVYSSDLLENIDKNFIVNHSISFITYNQKLKEQIEELYPQKEIHFYNPIVTKKLPSMDWETSLVIKEKYAEGEEYFLVNAYAQSINHSIEMLKGFSVFKKWQKSSMKLVILTDEIFSLQEKLSNYKYRNDVFIINQPDEEARESIIAAAYCALHLIQEDADNIFVQESISAGIPLLLKKNSSALYWLENNAFFVDEFSHEAIGQAFITMYKAENIRSHYIDYMENHSMDIPNSNISLSLLS